MNYLLYRAALETKQSELSNELFSLDEIAVERAADPLDNALLANQRDLAMSHCDRKLNLLGQVQEALLRMEDGSYGVCLHCEEEISKKRLTALPWAGFCIHCQELSDQGRLEEQELSVRVA